MELIYSMRRKPLKCEPPHFDSTQDPEIIRPLCTISSCNIIAFTSVTELSDCDGETWGGYVYVCDLDTPWDSHKVTSTVHPVSALEWDGEGKQLLVGTTVGEVSVYGQKDYLLNEWTCLYSANFAGERIIKASFFHNGRRFVTLEKKPDAPIPERIQMLRSAPTLKGFGGVACAGAVVVTATGLVGALTPGEGGAALTATDCLRGARDHVVCASIAHKGSTVLVAAAWRRGRRRGVRCAAGALARPLALRLSPLPALQLADDAAGVPVSVAWWLRDDGEALLVAGTQLALWKLAERAYPVHKLLAKGQGGTAPVGPPKTADCFNTVSWQQTCSWALEAEGGSGCAGVTCVSAARTPLGAAHAVLATPHHLHLLARDTHHYLLSRPVGTGGGAGAAPEASAGAGTPPKKTKYGDAVCAQGGGAGSGGGATVRAADMSALGGVVVCVDSRSQLHAWRVAAPAADIPTPLSVTATAGALEYALVAGLDALDLLVTLKPNVVDAVCERLTENFQRQPAAFQQYYYHGWLKLRIALYSLSAGGSGSAAALTALQMCHAAWAAGAAAARPDPDAPAPLAALLDDAPDDKSLLALEAKLDTSSDPALPAALQPLQGLRRPLQRAVHTVLTALAALHAAGGAAAPGGYELWADAAAVSLLRRLVLAARACGCGGDALSRPLARLAAALTAAPPAAATAKPDLLEECASVSAGGARVWDGLPRTAVAAPHARPHPLYLEYGVEPESLRVGAEPPPHAASDHTPTQQMDAIRYMYLGGGRCAARWRRCGRCGARALPAPRPARHPLQRAHDARFLPACRCGGKWTLFSNV
ncbi:mediator of RNA polymerase II transcription subunit 16 [Aricia agestis]|uniref:mediator of RNA polymerase II transcription subunit 16 n=1 Tax=Aricia agestis TaxID=91739 RepID=UPI001C20BF75|nr:mediator of RNA polymerase II transcription subunit 16 [Aricia agestis]